MAYQENHTLNVKPVEQVKGAHRRTLVDRQRPAAIVEAKLHVLALARRGQRSES